MITGFASENFVFDTGGIFLVTGAAPFGATVTPDIDDGTLSAGDTLDISGSAYTYVGTISDGIALQHADGHYIILTNTPLPFSIGTFDPATDITATDFIYCFTRGTMIETSTGDRLIETLEPGDLVKTLDRGFQPIRWIGKSNISANSLALQPGNRPIRIAKGTLGNVRDMVVSPAHRLHITGWMADILFGQSEILVAAKDLVNDSTITVESGADGVEYWHMLFDQHELVWAEGCLSESLNPSDAVIGAGQGRAKDEILELFPELGTGDDMQVVRPALSALEAQVL